MVAPAVDASRLAGCTGADVLVVGAGPTGLTTALQAHAHGARVRLVERRPEAYRPSRAMIVHSRTLECLRPLGVTDALLERGDPTPLARLHLGSREVTAQLGEVALPDTAFPHLTMIRQIDVEEVLADALGHRGVHVERAVEYIDGRTEDCGVWATLVRDGRREQVACRFVVGCDGQASTVRQQAGIGWHGGPYREEAVLADLELDADLEPGLLHVVAGARGLVFLFALGEGATWRLLATRPSSRPDTPFGQPGDAVPRSEVQDILDEAGLRAAIQELPWSARVRLQHRLASTFRAGPFFLAGDAAHTHSPAAAQGMNTGIVDAVNLGWKVAYAVHSDRGDPLLDSYGDERRPVARQVLALTHLIFFAEASTSPLPAFLRETLVPLVAPALPLLLRQRIVMAAMVRMLSQGWVKYRTSALSVEGASGGRGARPGDRLPDEQVMRDGQNISLHELIARPGIHVLLSRDAEPIDPGELGRGVSVHRITSWPGRGLQTIRPDGHVGLRSGCSDRGEVCAWLDLVGARG